MTDETVNLSTPATPFVPLTEEQFFAPRIAAHAQAWNDVLRWLHFGGDDAVGFNMNDWYEHEYDYPDKAPFVGFVRGVKATCDTIACIGGYLANHSPQGIPQHGMSYSEGKELFFSAVDANIPPSVAEAVVRSFLTTGEINWPEEWRRKSW